MTKHSQSLQQSNPLIMSSSNGQAAAVNTGPQAPYNVTGVMPGATTSATTGEATLAINNVKRVWGAKPSEEEVKAPEPAPTAAQPTATTGPAT